MAISYTIDKSTFEVYVFDTDVNADVPFLAQPNFPDGSAFTSVTQATAWAKAFIKYFNDNSLPLPNNADEL